MISNVGFWAKCYGRSLMGGIEALQAATWKGVQARFRTVQQVSRYGNRIASAVMTSDEEAGGLPF